MLLSFPYDMEYASFLSVYVSSTLYRAVIVSFLPLFANRAIHFTSLLLRPFGEPPSCNLVLKPFFTNHHAAIFPLWHGTCFFFVGVCVFSFSYWAVIVSFLPPFANRAIHFTSLLLRPLVNCTNHFFLKSVLCSSAKMSHGQRFYISMGLQKGRLVLLSSSSNSVPNLLQQVVSPKERS